jgi:hypothetical protein
MTSMNVDLFKPLPIVNLYLIWPEGYRSDPGKNLLISASFFTGVTTPCADIKIAVEKIRKGRAS